jgi:hypothetical protein
MWTAVEYGLRLPITKKIRTLVKQFSEKIIIFLIFPPPGRYGNLSKVLPEPHRRTSRASPKR